MQTESMPQPSPTPSPHQVTLTTDREVENEIDSVISAGDDEDDDDDDDEDPLEPVHRMVKIKPRRSQIRPGAYIVAPFMRNDVIFTNNYDDFTTFQGDDNSIMMDPPDGAGDHSSLPTTYDIEHMDTTTAIDEDKGVSKRPCSQMCCWRGGGVLLLVMLIISVGVGFGLPHSRPVAPSETQSKECSMSQIIDECSRSEDFLPTGMPACIMERYAVLHNNFIPKLDLSLDSNSCSPENLALMSVAFFSAEEEDPMQLLTNRFGLSVLFFATNGHQWKSNDGWITSASHCEWHGVECGSSNGVEVISLGSNKLRGYLPSILPILLSDLRSVLVDDNTLTGTLPVQYSTLENINVGYNNLVGTFPSTFFTSTKTVRLIVQYNNFDISSMPVSFPGTQWQQLLLNGVNFESGPLPTKLFALTMLSHLNVGFTNRQGTLPTEIGQLTNLEELNLSGNQFMTTIPSQLGNLSRLSTLSLVDCTLTGTMPSELGRLTELISLRIDQNVLSGTMPSEIGQLRDLEEFMFNDNRLRGTIPSEVCGLRVGNNATFFELTAPILDYDASQAFGGLTCPTDILECCEISL